MAVAGNELVNPVTGHRLVFRQTAAETGGALVDVDSFWAPGPQAQPDHYHPFQEERFEVVSGRLFVRLGGHGRILRAGDVLIIPPGVPHEISNGGGEVAHVIWQTRPALETEAFFETVWCLGRQGKTNGQGMPGLLQSAVLMREFADEIRFARPPWTAQRAIFGVLAPVGRLLGHRARLRYPYPYTRRPAPPAALAAYGRK